MRNERAEQSALPDAFRQAQALKTLGAIPLVVFTAALSAATCGICPEWCGSGRIVNLQGRRTLEISSHP